MPSDHRIFKNPETFPPQNPMDSGLATKPRSRYRKNSKNTAFWDRLYLTALPPRELLQQKLHAAIEMSKARLEIKEGGAE